MLTQLKKHAFSERQQVERVILRYSLKFLDNWSIPPVVMIFFFIFSYEVLLFEAESFKKFIINFTFNLLTPNLAV